MTLSEWISNYCQENEIELPDDIPDDETALLFLNTVDNSGGGGGENESDTVVIHFDEANWIYDITPAQAIQYLSEGKRIVRYKEYLDYSGTTFKLSGLVVFTAVSYDENSNPNYAMIGHCASKNTSYPIKYTIFSEGLNSPFWED